MLKIALRGIRDNPIRFLSTGLAIVLGVGFFVGTLVLSHTLRSSITNSIEEAFAGVDAIVRSKESIEFGGFEIRATIPATETAEVEEVSGVAAAAPVLRGYAQVVKDDGKALSSNGTPFGLNWVDDEQLNPFRISEGATPEAADEIVIDEGSFEDGSFRIGQEVRVLPLGEDQPFKLVGVFSAGDEASFGGQRMTAFTLEGAQSVFGTDQANQIWADAEPGVTPGELEQELNKSLPADLEAVSGEEAIEEFEQQASTATGVINQVLLVFSAVALFVGAFIIYNTFSITVSQRTREMALLRAVGAGRRQVTSSVLLESLLVGIVSSVIGVLVGIGLAQLILVVLERFGVGFAASVAVPLSALGLGTVVGVVITLFAALIPARRAARVPPVQAMRQTSLEATRISRSRLVLGLLLALLGGGAAARGLIGNHAWSLAWSGAFLLVAVIVLGPILAGALSQLLGAPLVALRGTVGEIARSNAGRNPRRSAITALALTIGITLVTAATVFASTMQTSLDNQYRDQITADLVVAVDPGIALFGGGLSGDTQSQIAAVEGVSAAVPVRTTFAEYDDEAADIVSGVTAAEVDRVLDIGVSEGSLTDLAEGTVAVYSSYADDAGLKTGDTVTLRFQLQSIDLRIVAEYDKDQLVGNWVVDNSVIARATPQALDSLILVDTEEGRTTEVERRLDDLLADNPTAQVQTPEEYAADQAGSINTLLYVMWGLLGFSVLIALLGVVNTMALSIFERTRELGLLRAVGMTRRQLRSAVRYEAGIIGFIGTVLGLGLGLFLGFLGSEAADSSFPDFAVPWMQLAIIAVVGLVSGIVSGNPPVRRASRLDILDAIQHE